MSPKIVTVVGATGSQGKGVIRAFANNPAYHIRALTRNPSSESAQALASSSSVKNLEVVAADINDLSSLKTAFAGSSIIFGVTNFFEPFLAHQSPERAMEIEYQQGVNLALAAASTLDTGTNTLEHYFWSTLPDTQAISEGRFLVPHFDAKRRVDTYIREHLPHLLAKTTLLWVGFYHTNLRTPLFTPVSVPSAGGQYLQFGTTSPDTPYAVIGDVTKNMAPFIKAIVDNDSGEGGQGQAVLVEIGTFTAEEFLRTWAEARGVKAKYVRIGEQDYREIWPLLGEEIGVMNELWDAVRERSWSVTVEGQKLVTRKELGIDDGEFETLAESFKSFEV